MAPRLPCPLLVFILLVSPIAAKAEDQCFASRTKTSETYLKLDLPEKNGPVSGTESGVVHDDEQGYYTSWESVISGTRNGKRLKVTLETRIEDDSQTSKEVWTIRNGAILAGDDRFEPEDCATARIDGDSEGYANDEEPQGPEAGRGQCGEAENVIFTCDLDNSRTVSVCAAADLSDVAFRYGGPGAVPEVTFPQKEGESLSRFMIHSISYSGGYDTGLGFRRGKETYVLREQMIGNGSDTGSAEMAGSLTVYRGRKITQQAECSSVGDAGMGLNKLGDVVPQKQFFDEDGLLP